MKPAQISAAPLGLALYGGSFDPVHCAHLSVAHAALEQVELDKVIFIPAARSPLKASTTYASDAERIEMLRLATADEPRFEVDCCEIERGGVSYSVDTIMLFRQQKPELPLYWIIGADQFELLPKWHRIAEIASQLTFIVLRRPGYALRAPQIDQLTYVTVDAPLMEHSSSEIRIRLAEGRSVDGLITPTVEAFISSRELYTR